MLTIIWLFCIASETAFAEGEWLSKEQSDKVVKVINGIITAAASILWLLTSFVTVFLYPGWVNGTLFGLQDYLKEIWILVSNIVYFIFAFIIIVIAFMNIIWKWEGNWELKQAMPKFIVWVLIVPFSWFFVQFVLAISAVLTVGMLTLPYDSFKDQSLLWDALADTKLWGTTICKDVIIFFSDEQPAWSTDLSADWENTLSENIRCKWEGSEVTVEELFNWEWDGLDNTIFGVISVYTYGILQVQNMDTLQWFNLTTIKGIADLIFSMLFNVLFIIIYMLLMVALFLALLVRGIRLWIYAMLSPAFGLLYFFGKWSDGFWESGEKFNIKEFIALALVPVYVAAALSFGLIFILVASEWIKQKASTDDLDTIEAGGFSLSIKWAHGWGEEEVSVIWKLIVELFWVVILWIAVMAALWSSKTTKAIVEPIAAFWKSVWELAAKAPTYAPIIPTGWWPWSAMSVTWLQQVWSTISSTAEQSARARWSEFAKWLPGADWNKIDLSTKSINALKSFQANGNKITRESLSDLRDAIKAGWSIATLANDPQFIKTINDIKKSDIAFKDNAILKEDISIWKPDQLAKALSEMDRLIDANYSSAGTLMQGTELWSQATARSVNERIFWEWWGEQKTETTNTFNVRIDGSDIKDAKLAANRLEGKNDTKNLEGLNKAMTDAGITEAAYRTAIIEASKYSSDDTDWNGVADEGE